MPRQRPAHRREYAGPRLPCGLSAMLRRACRGSGPVRKPEGDGPAPADLSLRAAGEPVRPPDARDHPAHIRGESRRLSVLMDRMLRLTGYFSALAGAAVLGVGTAAGRALYGSAEAGLYLVILGPAMPLMYLESMVDGAMKGMGEQKAVVPVQYVGLLPPHRGGGALLPRFGMKGFLFVILLSSLYTCAANTGRLLFPAAACRCGSGGGWGRRVLRGGRCRSGAGAAEAWPHGWREECPRSWRRWRWAVRG